jgi:hypothetical protein
LASRHCDATKGRGSGSGAATATGCPPSSARSYLTLEPRWRPHAAGLFFQWPPPRMAASRTMAGMAKTNHSSFKATPSRASPFRRPWTRRRRAAYRELDDRKRPRSHLRSGAGFPAIEYASNLGGFVARHFHADADFSHAGCRPGHVFLLSSGGLIIEPRSAMTLWR